MSAHVIPAFVLREQKRRRITKQWLEDARDACFTTHGVDPHEIGYTCRNIGTPMADIIRDYTPLGILRPTPDTVLAAEIKRIYRRLLDGGNVAAPIGSIEWWLSPLPTSIPGTFADDAEKASHEAAGSVPAAPQPTAPPGGKEPTPPV